MTENDRISALENQLAQMSQQIGSLQHAIGLLEDSHAVRCLQHKYGYYIDKCLYDQTVDFATLNWPLFDGLMAPPEGGAR